MLAVTAVDADIPSAVAKAYREVRRIGFEGQFLIEPKPKEPTKHQYDFDAATVLNFLRQYDLLDHFKLNIEANHATLAGHTMQHDLEVAGAADPEPAWSRPPRGTRLERVCCFKYRRTVARDGTVRAGATTLQLPAKPNGRSRAGQRVELWQCLSLDLCDGFAGGGSNLSVQIR